MKNHHNIEKIVKTHYTGYSHCGRIWRINGNSGSWCAVGIHPVLEYKTLTGITLQEISDKLSKSVD